MIVIYTLAEILPGSQAIWQILDAISQKYTPTHLLRVSRGALVPPAPWLMLEFLLAVMVISAFCKPRALQRRHSCKPSFHRQPEALQYLPERSTKATSIPVASGKNHFPTPSLWWRRVCELAGNLLPHRKWFLFLIFKFPIIPHCIHIFLLYFPSSWPIIHSLLMDKTEIFPLLKKKLAFF